ncbi:MAG: oligopeptide transporter ATP-binding protein OppF [Pseudomonadota bacterium]|jgi:peptide/nickel transport system ATP-binding protein
MKTQPLLQVRDLSLAFARQNAQGATTLTDALSNIQFDLYAGETLALLGESGCGKSLTSLAMMRLLPPNARYQSGRLLLATDDPRRPEDLLRVAEARMRQVRGHRMAMIFQEPATSLNPVMRIGEQIAEVIRLHRGLDQQATEREVRILLDQVGLPDPERAAAAYPFELSGGMKQRAMIAMALAGDPQILLADEPTTALDVTLQAQILDLIRSLQQQRQMGVLLITHDLAVVASRADRVAVMYAGQIVESGAVADVLHHPAHPYTRALLAALPERAGHGQSLLQLPGRVPSLGLWPMTCRFAPRCADQEPHCLVESPPQVIMPADQTSNPVSHQVLCWRAGDEAMTTYGESGVSPRRGPFADTSVLTVRDLQVRYESSRGAWLWPLSRWFGRKTIEQPVVDGVSLQLKAGETLALVGESGCGKTTTARAILGLQPLCGGEIVLNGAPIAGQGIRPPAGWRRNVQMVFQDPFASLDPRQRIRSILAEGPRALGLASATTTDGALSGLLERVGLAADALDRYPHEFSGGQRQRIAIARALAVNPALLICDEPTSALDVSVQAQILNLLLALQAETGMAYLFITHNFGVVRYLADRVAVMQAGRIVESGTTHEIFEQPQHAYTKALLASVPVIR